MGCLVLGAMVYRTTIGHTLILASGVLGTKFIWTCPHHVHVVAQCELAAARKHFLRSASNDHYIERNDSSSPILPTINDIRWKIGNMSDYYSCTVYARQFQDTLQRGWLKHSNRVQLLLRTGTAYRESRQGRDTLQRSWQQGNRVLIALACRHSGHRVSCMHGARVAAKHCVCCHPWLQSLAAYCCHSFCMCNAQLGSPHNAVYCLVEWQLYLIGWWL